MMYLIIQSIFYLNFYLYIIAHMVLIICLLFSLLVLAYLLSTQVMIKDVWKLLSYEYSFQAFADICATFNFQFYLVSEPYFLVINNNQNSDGANSSLILSSNSNAVVNIIEKKTNNSFLILFVLNFDFTTFIFFLILFFLLFIVIVGILVKIKPKIFNLNPELYKSYELFCILIDKQFPVVYNKNLNKLLKINNEHKKKSL